jgi:hypothetical protein
VNPKSHIVRPRTVLDPNLFRSLALVKAPKPKLLRRGVRSGPPIFSAAEMRHNFAIWALRKDAAPGRPLHLYYCLRCKWAFAVDDRRGHVIPLDQSGEPIQETEAAQRLATFGQGPCPAFSRLTEDRRLTQEVAPLETFRRRLAGLILAGCRAWKLRVWRWRQSVLLADQNQRRASK